MKDTGSMIKQSEGSYGSLYRKMRPQTFADIIGQKHVVEALRRQVATGNIAHAYLFSGSRGTGKTSTALVFARAINCLNPHDGEPCMACENCLGASSVDVVEMDAASYNSVDDIRQLREYVKYAPAHGRKKIYIIDEVHMLSNAAFNALLKTLEEPPSHIVFILATTELHMIPATVQSRCQRYDFKRVSKEGMRRKILEVASKFGAEVEDSAVDLIIRVADGSMRDTLALLEQSLSLELPRLTETEIADIFGVVRTGDIVEIVGFALLGKVKGLADRLEALFGAGIDALELLSGIISTLRDVLLLCISEDYAVSGGEEYGRTLRGLAAQAKKTEVEALFDKMVELSKFMRYSKNKESIIEATLLVFADKRRSDAGSFVQEPQNAPVKIVDESVQSQSFDLDCTAIASQAQGGVQGGTSRGSTSHGSTSRGSTSYGSVAVESEACEPSAPEASENALSSAPAPENAPSRAASNENAPQQGADLHAPSHAVSVENSPQQGADLRAASNENAPQQSAEPEKKTVTYIPRTSTAAGAGEKRSAEELKKLWNDILSHVPADKKLLLKNSEIALFVGGEILVHIKGLSPAREMLIERNVKADVVDAANLVTGRECMVKFEAIEKTAMENAEDVVNVKKYFEEKDISIEIV